MSSREIPEQIEGENKSLLGSPEGKKQTQEGSGRSRMLRQTAPESKNVKEKVTVPRRL